MFPSISESTVTKLVNEKNIWRDLANEYWRRLNVPTYPANIELEKKLHDKISKCDYTS